MTEWIVEIETAESLTASADDLERFAAALDTCRGTTGAAASLDTEREVLSASFSVEAADAVGAADVGVAFFRRAMSDAGLAADASPTRVAVEQIGLARTA